jgi:galactokinase
VRLHDRTGSRIRVRSAGRVNLIGDHVDYMGGPVLPMAIDLATTLEATVGGGHVELHSDLLPEPAAFALPAHRARSIEPPWARYCAAVAEQLGAGVGLVGDLRSTIPAGAGLSSSAALELAVAVALGAEGAPAELALLCQAAEHEATGVPSGVMDQLCIAAGRAGHATLIDCAALAVEHVPMPPTAEVWVVHSGQARRLGSSDYARRRATAEAAAHLVGGLVGADPARVEAIDDDLLRRRARHVTSECTRVRRFRDALSCGDLDGAGTLMDDSHASLRDDYEVSTPALDRLVVALRDVHGVVGARLTGAGFGGCAVALARAGVGVGDALGSGPLAGLRRWRVEASDGLHLEVL